MNTDKAIICKIVLLDFVHHLNYKIIKLQHFQSWILLGPLAELTSDVTRSEASISRFQLLNRCTFIIL
jgi:hypothetical protein